MLSALLISLLALQRIAFPAAIGQPPVINEAIRAEQIINYPQSLGIKITAKSALVIDAETNQVLFQKNSQQILSIASLTKLMTALVVLDSQPDWQRQIKITAEDNVEISQAEKKLPSQIGFRIGELVKVEDLFMAGLIKSANNAIKALVRSVGSCCGKTFVDKMNNKAQELAMMNTVFTEPTGLDVGNQSTAEDLAKLIKVVVQKPKIQQALLQKVYNFQTTNQIGENRFYQIKNTDKLLDSFLKIKVAKTGYLDEAGYCFAGIVEYNNKELIVVILGSQSEQDRIQEVEGLTHWATSIVK